MEGMSAWVSELFASVLDTSIRLRDEGDRSVKAAVHSRCGNKARWYGKQWFVPVPRLQFDTRPVPQLTITIQAHLVSPVEVETDYNSYSLTLVGAIGKPETLVIPMIFLLALLDNDLEHFRLVAKDSSCTTREVPGTKSIRLPNDLVNKLYKTLERKSVAVWLGEFGCQGRTVAPQVVGSLWGLQHMDIAQPLSTGQQAWGEEFVINALEGLGYSTKEAKEMFNRAAPSLKADLTQEEAIRLVLQQAGREG